jgi:hypothetical protein
MPNVVIKITKGSADEPWIILTTDFIKENFSADEISNTIIPYTNFRKQLPGFQETSVTYPDSLTMLITHSFDTVEHATAALTYFEPPYETGSLADNMRLLLENLRNKLGVTYTWDFSVE